MAKRVLVIDDDPVGVALMQSRLVKEGYLVLVERNGKTGLARVKLERPDAIILDVEMPEMNGYSFIVALRADPFVSETPVIVQTSHPENKAIFGRYAIKHYLIKPVNFDILLPALKDTFGE